MAVHGQQIVGQQITILQTWTYLKPTTYVQTKKVLITFKFVRAIAE